MEDKTFFEDFRKFQDECPEIPLNKEHGKKSDKFYFKYADLASILKAVRPVLSKNNLIVYWPLNIDGSVTCVLQHKSGNKLESTCNIKAGDDPKKQGAAITYSRRYTLVALLGIVAEEDKDAPPTSTGQAKAKMTSDLFNDAKNRIIKGDPDILKKCLLTLDITEEQKDALTNLELQYNL